MNDYMTINNKSICIKEIESQRVVTFYEVDELHERPSGTARRNFNTNNNHFIENEDYYLFKGEKGRKALVELGYTDFVKLNNNNNFKMYLLTESGYLMIVKSLTDELAWKVQKELVKNYFRLKEIATKVENNLPIVKQDIAPVNQFDFMKAMFGCIETNHQDIETLKNQTELQAQEIREAKQELQEFKNKLKKIAQ